MKKLLGLVVLFILLSSCENTQNKFLTPENERITSEDWFLVTHADSSDLLPCIVMDDYILVIKDTENETQVMKMNDMTGDFNSFALFMTILVFILIFALVLITAVD